MDGKPAQAGSALDRPPEIDCHCQVSTAMQPPNVPPAESPLPTPPAQGRWRWPWFAAALLTPPLLTTLAALLDRRGSAAPALGFLGAAAGGLVCGILLGCHVGKTGATKALLSVVFSGVCAVAILAMSFFGCMVGNYQLDFR